MSRYYETHARQRASRRAHAEPARRPTCSRARARRCAASSMRARPREIVFVRGTTEAINLVAQSYGRPRLQPGDEILISQLEHHANIVPWQMVCEQTGARLEGHSDHRSRRSRLRGVRALLGPRTRLLALAHVSNALGTIVPVERFIARGPSARRPGAARRRAGRAAPAGRRAGARLRLLLLLRPQDVRPDRYRRAVRPRSAARRDAALAGRRRHDPRGQLREDDLQRAAVQVRGRHAAHRRRRSGSALRSTTSRTSAWIASPPRSTNSLLEYATARWPRIPGLQLVGTAPREGRRRVLHAARACIRTTSARSSTTRASRSAPAITARCR